MRPQAIERVLAALGDAVLAPDGLSTAEALQLQEVATELMEIADEEPIGPGTPRMTVAGAAVYAADRLTVGKAVTQADVVDAVETVVSTTKGKIGRYGRMLYDIADERGQPGAVVAVEAVAD